MDAAPTAADDLFRVALELSPSGMFAVDAEGTIILVNRETERLFGYGREELLGQPVELLVPARFRGAHPHFRARYFGEPSARPMGVGRDLYGLRKDGAEVPVEIGLNPVETSRGLVVLATVVDISSRKKAEQRFQAAVESAPSGMVMVDGAGRIVLVNRETERLFGYERDELIGKPVEVLVPERLRERHPGHRAGFFASPSARPMGAGRELFGLHKDRTEIPVEIGLNPIVTDEGTYVLSSIVDIRHRRQAWSDLRASEARFRLLVDGIKDYAIYMLDAAGHVESWNAGAERIQGYASAEVLGQSFSIFFTAEDQGAGIPADLLTTANRRGLCEREGWSVRRDGSRFLANDLTSALRDAEGHLRGYARISRDITNDRRLEQRLRQSQKMEAIGTLAGGIAHDFNNILLAIVGYTELASEVSASPAVKTDLAAVLKAADRGRQLVQRILTFSRMQDSLRVPMHIERAANEALQLLRATLPANIEIRTHFDDRTPLVLSDETQIQQILMNLASNSAYAMAEHGGVLDVSLTPFHVDEAFATSHPGLTTGPCARLTVADSGAGMSPEVLERAFEPFFTTKPAGAGTGLGLSVLHGIVQTHGGVIDVRSRPGVGTVIDVYLPAVEAVIAPAPAPHQDAFHVLCVEDEEALAALLKRQLEAAGYRVTVHTSSLQALEDFRAHPNEFDLLVTDNTMPRMTGFALSQEILKIRPEMSVLMVSGLADGMDPEALRARGIRGVLRKPHTRLELCEAVGALLPPTAGGR